MPYVAKFADGTYLIRVANARSYKNRRRRTDDLSEATQWTSPGHVKNALVHAAEERVVVAGEAVHIVEVSVEERVIRERIRVVGKSNSFRTEKV
jgi:hypothetical protein